MWCLLWSAMNLIMSVHWTTLSSASLRFKGHSCYNKKKVFFWLWWHWLHEAVTQKKGDGASNDDKDNEHDYHDNDDEKDADDDNSMPFLIAFFFYAHNKVCPVNACLLLNKRSCLSLCCRRHELGKVMKISYPFFHQEKGRLTCAKCTKEKQKDPLQPQQLCWTTVLNWMAHWGHLRSTMMMTLKRFTTRYLQNICG